MKKGIKVLFFYPNTFGMNMLPPAIAMFSAILKKKVIKLKSLIQLTTLRIMESILMEAKWKNLM